MTPKIMKITSTKEKLLFLFLSFWVAFGLYFELTDYSLYYLLKVSDFLSGFIFELSKLDCNILWVRRIEACVVITACIYIP